MSVYSYYYKRLIINNSNDSIRLYKITLPKNEIWGEFEMFKQSVQPLRGLTRSASLREEKHSTH